MHLLAQCQAHNKQAVNGSFYDYQFTLKGSKTMMKSWAASPAPCSTPNFPRPEAKQNGRQHVPGWEQEGGFQEDPNTGSHWPALSSHCSLPLRTQTKDTGCWTSSWGRPSLCSRDTSASCPQCTSHGCRTHGIWAPLSREMVGSQGGIQLCASSWYPGTSSGERFKAWLHLWSAVWS